MPIDVSRMLKCRAKTLSRLVSGCRECPWSVTPVWRSAEPQVYIYVGSAKHNRHASNQSMIKENMGLAINNHVVSCAFVTSQPRHQYSDHEVEQSNAHEQKT